MSIKRLGEGMGGLRIVPVTFAQACEFVAEWHRHHAPPVGHKFSVGIGDGNLLVGVAIVGRPVARMFDDGSTLEVLRTATDATPHANSMLYGTCWRAAKALGYRRLVTYTEQGESGASRPRAGWLADRRAAATEARLGPAIEAAGEQERQRPAVPVGGIVRREDTPMGKIADRGVAGRMRAERETARAAVLTHRRDPGPTEHQPSEPTGRRYAAVADGTHSPCAALFAHGVSTRGAL